MIKHKVLYNRNFRLLTFGQMISTFGDTLYLVAMLWIAAEITDSNTKLSFISVCDPLPAIFLGFFSGVIVDRNSKKKIMIIADFARCVLIFGFSLVFAFGKVNIYYIFILTLLIAFFQGLYNPAQFSITPKIVEQCDLKDANSISTFILNIITIIGNSVCGFAFKYLGGLWTLWVNCFSFILSALSTKKIQYVEIIEKEEVEETNILKDSFSAVKYLLGKQNLLLLLFLSLTLNLVSGSFYCLPLFIKNSLNQDIAIYGIVEAFGAAGMLLGALIVIKIVNSHYYKIMILAGVFECVCFIGIALSSSPLSVFLLRFILGCNNAIFNVMFATLFQQEVDDIYRGRIYAISFMVSTISLPISALLSGRVADIVSIRFSWLFFGVMALLLCGLNYCISLKGGASNVKNN